MTGPTTPLTVDALLAPPTDRLLVISIERQRERIEKAEAAGIEVPEVLRESLAEAEKLLAEFYPVVRCPICGDEYVLPQDGDPSRRCPTCGSPALPAKAAS